MLAGSLQVGDRHGFCMYVYVIGLNGCIKLSGTPARGLNTQPQFKRCVHYMYYEYHC